MTMGLVRAAAILALAPMLAGQSDQATRDGVLSRAADYLDRYERSIEGVTAVEVYTQRVGMRDRRVLQSDILFIRDDAAGWVEFRDVARVDGTPVRDREKRVEELFVKPTPDRLKQAQRIVREGTRYNLKASGPGLNVNRTLNLPLTPLRYLRRSAQRRSAFLVLPAGPDPGRVVVDFTEQSSPRLISTDDGKPARGRFEVDVASGRILKAELTVTSRSIVGTLQVDFAEEPRLALWLPRSMSESYTGLGQAVTGTAEYSSYRKFQVQAEYEIGK